MESAFPAETWPRQVSDRSPLPAVWLFAALLLLYLLGGAPGTLFGDGGMLAARVRELDLVGEYGLALAHPLYILLAWLWVGFFPLAPALALNQFSALLSATTITLLFLGLQRATGAILPALCGALALGLAWPFWRSAGGAEVYPLVLLLLTLEWHFAPAALGGKRTAAFALGLCGGLGLSTHPFALISGTVWLLTGLHARLHRRVCLPFLPWLGGILAGLVPLLPAAIPLLTGSGPLALVASYLHGDRFAAAVWNLHLSPTMIGESLLFLGYSFPLPLLFLLPRGLKHLRVGHPPLFAAGILQFLLFFFFALRYPVADRFEFFLPAWLLLAAGLGLAAARCPRRFLPLFLICSLLIPSLLYAAAPGILPRLGLRIPVAREIPDRKSLRWFLVPWGRDNTSQRFARRVLASLPAGALLYADGTTVWPLQALLDREERPDLRLFSSDRIHRRRHPWPTDWLCSSKAAAGLLFTVHPGKAYCPLLLRQSFRPRPAGPVWRLEPVALRRGTSLIPPE